MTYQDTPAASKHNAFCWRSWEQQINWRAGAAQEAGRRKRAQQIDDQRAAGKDPLFIAGMSSGARQNPLDATRFAIATARRTSRHG